MAKPLNFKINSQVYGLEPLKLDRKKLYGGKQKLVLDDNHNECNTISLFSDRSIIIPKGGLGLGSISEDGKWVDKFDMVYVDLQGEAVDLVPSSFDSVIELKETVSVETFLEHNITSIYSLQGEENHPAFVGAIAGNKRIFTFIFNFRADYEGDPAFIVENAGELFVLIGKKIEFDFISLDEAGAFEDGDSSEDEDEFDFSMM
jgi:hypothetical protein